MIPLLVWPQEQRLGQMLTRVLAVLEEQDLYALPGDVRRRQSDYFFNWNTTEDEDDDEDEVDQEAAATARRSGAGDGSVTSASQHLRYIQEQQQLQRAGVDGNGHDVPIIVIRPVARRPRQQRRILEARRPRRKLGDGAPGSGWFDGDKYEYLKKMGYANTPAVEAADNQAQTSRSRSRSPPSTSAYYRHRHHGPRNSDAADASRMQNPYQFPRINN